MSFSPTEQGRYHRPDNIEVPGTNVVYMVVYNILRIKGVRTAYRVNK